MKYVIVKDGQGAVISKDVYAGDESGIILGVNSTEVDSVTFDATAMIPQPSVSQKSWTIFQSTKPTLQEQVDYLAKQIGLE